MSGIANLSMGILMCHQSEPMVRDDSSQIEQNCHRVSAMITETIEAKSGSQRHRKDLHPGAGLGMKAVVAGLHQALKVSVEGLVMGAEPFRDRGVRGTLQAKDHRRVEREPLYRL